MITLAFTCLSMFSCSDDDDDSPTQTTEITVNGTVLFNNGDDFTGDIDADFTGDGGSGSKTFTWQNSINTAEYNADITSTSGGSFVMVVKDADENIVLDKTLSGDVDPDSFSGVTSTGTIGIWSVTITLTSFDGDGSFSLSEGN